MFNCIYTLFLIIFILSCNKNVKKIVIRGPIPNDYYVQIQNGQFVYKKDTFFPLMLNYVACIRKIHNEYVLSPAQEYDDPSLWEGNTPDSVYHVLKGHLTLIKELGFNSIRFVYRVGLNRFQENQQITCYDEQGKQEIPLQGNEHILLNCANEFINLADSLGLKVMFLLEPPIDNAELKKYTIQLLQYFKDQPAIFAFDFFNEPLYFDNENKPANQKNREKEDAYRIVAEWNEMVRTHAPYHLFTIGFAEPIEVFEWDPSILPVDFVQIHTYHPLRYPNEVSWYCDYISKPVMIGETSLPADNDSITYEEQRQFMVDAFQYARDKGCIGFGWWQFQEVKWGNYEHDYTALINHQGITKTQNGNFIIQGSLKPAALEVKNLLNYQPKPKTPEKWVNYYNMLGYHNIVIKGRVLEAETQNPIEGAVIRGWTEWWDIAANTYTDSLGNFTLYSNKEFVHFQVSAPGKENLIFNFRGIYKPTVNNPIPWDKLPNQALEYHKISYHPFLSKDTTHARYKVFHFDPEKFNKAQYEATMKTIYLKKFNVK